MLAFRTSLPHRLVTYTEKANLIPDNGRNQNSHTTESLATALKHFNNNRFMDAFGIYIVLAEQNNKQAITCLGLMFSKKNGDESKINEETLGEIRNTCITEGYTYRPVLAYVLGLLYQHGLGGEQNDVQAVECYTLAHDAGFIAGTNNLGVMYQHGLGIDQDHEKAVKCYRFAHNAKFAAGTNNLGIMYQHGLGVEQDINEAYKLYVSIYTDFPEAANNLGLMYENGQLEVDSGQSHLEEAKAKYRRAVELGLQEAVENLARVEWRINGTLISYTEFVETIQNSTTEDLQEAALAHAKTGKISVAARYYLYLADAGDLSALTKLTTILRNIGVLRDPTASLRQAKQPSEDNIAEAKKIYYYCETVTESVAARYILGMKYLYGIGVKQDATEAFKYFSTIDTTKIPDAAYQIGYIYQYGLGDIENDDQKAIRYYTIASAAGSAEATSALKLMNQRGVDDQNTSVQTAMTTTTFIDEDDDFWSDAVLVEKSKPVVSTQNHLDRGLEYLNGTNGVKKSSMLAIACFTYASNRENAEASFQLGMMFLEGKGIGISHKKARKFLILADAQGHIEAAFFLSKSFSTTTWRRDADFIMAKYWYDIYRSYKDEQKPNANQWLGKGKVKVK